MGRRPRPPERLQHPAGDRHRGPAGARPNTATAHESTESLDADFDAAAAEFDIPAVLLKAIAWEHTRWQMVDGEEFEG